jgi:hypothetical protein
MAPISWICCGQIIMGAVATTRAAAPVLSDGGRIIFIGSGLAAMFRSSVSRDYVGTTFGVPRSAQTPAGVSRPDSPSP